MNPTHDLTKPAPTPSNAGPGRLLRPLGRRARRAQERVVESVQPFVGEPVIAAAPFQAKGNLVWMMSVAARRGVGFVSGMLDRAALSPLGKPADIDRLTYVPSIVLAVTESCLYAFDVSGGLRFHVKSLLGVWAYADVAATAHADIVMNLTLEFGDGVAHDLEARFHGDQKGNLRVVDEIVARARPYVRPLRPV